MKECIESIKTYSLTSFFACLFLCCNVSLFANDYCGDSDLLTSSGQMSSYANTVNSLASTTISGTTYFIVSTPEELIYLSQKQSYWDKNILQTADIDFDTDDDGVYTDESWLGDWNMDGTSNGAVGFSPIGNKATKFSGTYRGWDSSAGTEIQRNISGFLVDRISEQYVGLFGYVSGKYIGYVSIDEASVTGRNYTGGLAGYVYRDNTIVCTIEHCSFLGKISAPGGSFVGGLIGFLHSANNKNIVKYCSSAGSVSGSQSCGGLIGYNNCEIRNSFATVIVEGRYHIGGLAGSNCEGGSIINCYATGDVYGAKENIGGLVGYFGDDASNYANGSIRTSYATGFVCGEYSNNLGGLVGKISNASSTLDNCYATGAVFGDENVGGLVGSVGNNTALDSCYSTGYVDGTSNIGGFVGYNSGTITESYYDLETSGTSLVAGGNVGILSVTTKATQDFASILSGTSWDNSSLRPFLAWQSYNVSNIAPIKNLPLGFSDTVSFVGSTFSSGNALSLRYATIDNASANNWTTVSVAGSSSPYSITKNSLIEDKTYLVQPFIKRDDGFMEYGDMSTVKIKAGLSVNYVCPAPATGTVAIDANEYSVNASVTVLGGDDLSYDEHTFEGWNTAADGSGTAYVQGETFTISNSDVTLYAQWKQNCLAFVDEGGVRYYLVQSAEDLICVSQTNYYWDKNLRQTADIDFDLNDDGDYSDESWGGDWNMDDDLSNDAAGFSPIGSTASQFTGTYCGWDSSTGSMVQRNISGLYINREASNRIGLFGYVEGIYIKYISLDKADVKGNNYTGGLAGYSYRNSTKIGTTIEHCSFSGAVEGESHVGGLVGYSYSTNNSKRIVVIDCSSTGEVIATQKCGGLIGVHRGSDVSNSSSSSSVTGGSNVGGFVGYSRNQGPSRSVIDNCDATGIVTGTSSCGGLIGMNQGSDVSNSSSSSSVTGKEFVGGLVGSNTYNSTSGRAVIDNCYATGGVTGTNNNVGGLVGKNQGDVSNSNSSSNVTGKETVGGLVGSNTNYNASTRSKVSNCFSSGQVSGSGNNVGGFVGYSVATILYCSSSGDVVGVNYAGGFAGQLSGIFSYTFNSYATGHCLGIDNVGGFIGYHHDDAEVEGCYSTGACQGKNNVSAFIGLLGESGSDDAHMIYNYATGDISHSGALSNLGGLVGKKTNTASQAEKSFFDKTTSGSELAIGNSPSELTTSALSTSSFNVQSTFTDNLGTGWNFDTKANGRPYFTWQKDGSPLQNNCNVSNPKADSVGTGFIQDVEYLGVAVEEGLRYKMIDLMAYDGFSDNASGWDDGSSSSTWTDGDVSSYKRIVDNDIMSYYHPSGVFVQGGREKMFTHNTAIGWTSAHLDRSLKGLDETFYISYLAKFSNVYSSSFNYLAVGSKVSSNDFGVALGRISGKSALGFSFLNDGNENSHTGSSSDQIVNKTYLVVGKFTCKDNGQVETVDVWINPTSPSVEQAHYHTSITDASSRDVMTSIDIQSYFPDSAFIDEIKVGRSWESVLCGDGAEIGWDEEVLPTVSSSAYTITKTGLASGAYYVQPFITRIDGKCEYGDMSAVSVPWELDFGDLPEAYDSGNNPASHLISYSNIYIGSIAPDAESTPLYSAKANLDDETGIDDEDVESQILPFNVNELSYTLKIPVTNNNSYEGYLSAWLDRNQDKEFDNIEEYASVTVAANSIGTVTLNWAFNTASSFSSDSIALRLRASSLPLTLPYSLALDGEVEDHFVMILRADSLSTDSVTTICKDSALLYGHIEEGYSIVEYGFQYAYDTASLSNGNAMDTILYQGAAINVDDVLLATFVKQLTTRRAVYFRSYMKKSDGTYHYGKTIRFITEDRDFSLFLDGNGDCLMLDSKTSNNYLAKRGDNGEFSIDFWMKDVNSSSFTTLFSFNGSGQGLKYLAGSKQIAFYPSSSPVLSQPILDTLWQHIAISYDGADLYIYTDGVLNTQAPVSVPSVANSQVIIGAESLGNTFGQYFSGYLDAMRFWDVSLSQDQVNILAYDNVQEAVSGEVELIGSGEIITGLLYENLVASLGFNVRSSNEDTNSAMPSSLMNQDQGHDYPFFHVDHTLGMSGQAPNIIAVGDAKPSCDLPRVNWCSDAVSKDWLVSSNWVSGAYPGQGISVQDILGQRYKDVTSDVINDSIYCEYTIINKNNLGNRAEIGSIPPELNMLIDRESDVGSYRVTDNGTLYINKGVADVLFKERNNSISGTFFGGSLMIIENGSLEVYD